jgi:putative glycosyltransferase (TIGR04372 family)
MKNQRGREAILLRVRRKAKALLLMLPHLPGIALGYTLLPATFLLLLALRPFLVVRIQPMISWRLGHFAANIEMYLCERDAGLNVLSVRHLDIWYLWTEPCNFQLAAMWRRTVNIGPTWLLHPLYNLLKNFSVMRLHLIPSTDRDTHNLLDSSPPHLKFSEAEIQIGNAGLRKLGIPKGSPFVCLNVRDKSYLDKQSEDAGANVNWSYHNYRNCDVQNYAKAADELTRLGYFVIRMGAAVNEQMRTSNPMVIDYAGKGLRSDFMDIFLGAHCAFCISNGTGFDAVPFIFRRPILYVDHVPLGIINTFSGRFMATTKEHWLKSEDRQLSLEEILGTDAAWYTKSQDYEKAGIELRESSPEDIAQAVLEMEGRLSGTWRTSEEDEKLQAYFWSIFPRNNLHGEIRSRVGSHFLRSRLKRDYLEVPPNCPAIKKTAVC